MLIFELVKLTKLHIALWVVLGYFMSILKFLVLGHFLPQITLLRSNDIIDAWGEATNLLTKHKSDNKDVQI